MSVNTDAIKLYIKHESDDYTTIDDIKDYFGLNYIELYPILSHMAEQNEIKKVNGYYRLP